MFSQVSLSLNLLFNRAAQMPESHQGISYIANVSIGRPQRLTGGGLFYLHLSEGMSRRASDMK